MRRFLIFFFSLVAVANFLYSQNGVDKIKKQREKTLKEIEYANRLLEETKGKTRQSLNELNLINSKLSKRRQYIIGLEAETSVLTGSIEENNALIRSLQEDIVRINAAYARMILSMYKSRSKYNYLMYFLASENINQLYRRIRYMQIYQSFIRAQRVKRTMLQRELVQKNEELTRLISEKEALLNTTRVEYGTMAREVGGKKKLVDQLTKKQRDIEAEIKNKEKLAGKLDDEIRRIIDAERLKAKKNMTTVGAAPADRIVSNDFEKNRGFLPWPTQRGLITGKYGEHAHPDFKYVKVRNDGVYISTSKGEEVRSVFKGVVSKVFSIPGENYTVIIKHGIYYTLYHNMINVRVKAGQSVETKQVIGVVYTDEGTKESTLYFQLWKETERNDPELWLAN
jgi:septal ring factor EnvC (AmiA/AmiB activator)